MELENERVIKQAKLQAKQGDADGKLQVQNQKAMESREAHQAHMLENQQKMALDRQKGDLAVRRPPDEGERHGATRQRAADGGAAEGDEPWTGEAGVMPRMGEVADLSNAFDVPLDQGYDRRLDQTWPGRLAQEAMGAVLAPGRALQSTEPITTEEMIKPAADLAGLVTGGSYTAPARKGASGAGIRAYHSSPHDFDKFDLPRSAPARARRCMGMGCISPRTRR